MVGYHFGPFVVDPGRRVLTRDAVRVRLSAKTFDVLLALIERRDRLVDKDELIKLVWPGTFVSDDSLTQAISQIRRALGDDSANPKYIETAARQGYRFIGAVTEAPVPELAAAALPGAQPAKAWLGLRRPGPMAAALGAVALAAVALLFILTRAPAQQQASLVRFTLGLPEGTIQISGGTLSPDGRQVAFVAREALGTDYLWIRDLETDTVRRLPGTQGASRPFWSPDGSEVGFFAQNALKVMRLTDGMPRTLTTTAGVFPTGGSWSQTGTIIFARRGSEIFAITGGGAPAAVTTLDRESREAAHRWPQFLPDGRRFLFTAISDRAEPLGVFIGSIDSPTRTRLLDAPNTAAFYAPSGHLLFLRDGALLAQPFDTVRAQLTGEAVVIEPQVTPPSPENAQAISAGGGLLSFKVGVPERRLVWFSRDGERLGAIDTPTVLKNLLLSPDRRQLLADSNDALPGVWVVDLERGTRERLTDDGALPVAAPDGTIAYSSRRSGAPVIYARGGTPGDERPLLAVDNLFALTHWSPDGRHIVYETSSPATGRDLWVHNPDGSGSPRPLVRSPFNEIQGEVSPDGRWIAYASDESGTWEVYLQSFPDAGNKRIVSVGGGAQPRWRGDGRELFYLAPDRRIMAVSLDANSTVTSRPVPLFSTLAEGDLPAFRSHYVVSEDGRRFLIDSSEATLPPSIAIIVNWQRLLN